MVWNGINLSPPMPVIRGARLPVVPGGVRDGVDAVVHERLALGIRKRLDGPGQNDVRIYRLDAQECHRLVEKVAT